MTTRRAPSAERRVPSLSLVAAVAENRVIGRAGGLPWRLPDDLKFFKQLTTGHTVIMGRKTFDEVRRPLPNRRNVVISRDPAFRPDGVTVVPSLERHRPAARLGPGQSGRFAFTFRPPGLVAGSTILLAALALTAFAWRRPLLSLVLPTGRARSSADRAPAS